MSRFLNLLRYRGSILSQVIQSNLKIASNIKLATTSRCALLVTALLVNLGLISTLKYSRFSTLGKKVNLQMCLCSSFKSFYQLCWLIGVKCTRREIGKFWF